MDVVYPRCAAIDVHKRTAVVTVGWVDEQGQRHRRTRTYGTMTADVERLCQWLREQQVTHVAMGSTGVFWKPLVTLLEESGLVVVLANAAHVKAVPGRKTDVRDSEWLLELMQHGLVQGSFIPEAPIRELRELTRYRTSLIEERIREVNRVQKVLEDANIKLAAVATNTLGVSGRAMLEALIAGETDPAVLADLAQARLRRKQAQLVQALRGRVKPHHRLLLRELLDHIAYLERAIERLSAMIEEQTRPFAAALDLLCSIAGVGQRAAEVILAEIGPDMSRFPSARHRCSWAAVCPGNDESAGKRRSGRMRKGNRWLRTALLQSAWAAVRTKGSCFGAQFRRVAKRRGEKRAALAVAHRLLTVIYHVLTRGVFYEELGAAYCDRREPAKLASYHVRRLAELGYKVQLEPQSAA
jgi:transposase